MANPRQRDPLANTLALGGLATNRGSEPHVRDVVICLGFGDKPSNESNPLPNPVSHVRVSRGKVGVSDDEYFPPFRSHFPLVSLHLRPERKGSGGLSSDIRLSDRSIRQAR